MRRFLLSLLISGVLASSSLAAGSAVAAPTDTQFTIAGQAQLISPTTLLVEVTLKCDPFSFPGFPGTGFAQVSIRSEETGTIGFGSTTIPCDGTRRTGVIVVNGGPFVPGNAVASGIGCGFLCDQDTRRIQIVV